jgi:hypothetical protein
MQPDNERRLTRTEAAAFLSERGYRVAYATLNKYATVGGGPVFESFGRRPLYKPSSLLEWVESRTTSPRRSTSEPPALPAPSKAANLATGRDKP